MTLLVMIAAVIGGALVLYAVGVVTYAVCVAAFLACYVLGHAWDCWFHH